MKNVVVIGGGISGLSAAFYLRQYLGDVVDLTLIESTSRLGGKVISAHESGFIIEGGPDSFVTKKAATVEMCHALGLEDQFISSNSAEHTTYVWSRGRLHPVPEGMMLMAPTMVLPFLRSQLISWPGKLRMGMEMLIRSSGKDGDESLASFVRRRLGTEALEKIAAPLMAGIYSADPETLSLQSTFPLFPEMENKYGSLLRGLMMQKRAQKELPEKQDSQEKRVPMFMTLRGGLQQLIDAILVQLRSEDILLNRRVLSLTRKGDRYESVLDDGQRILADEVVFATPAYETAALVERIDPVLASKLRTIRYVSTATVSLGFKRSDINHPLNGFGFVVPHSENLKITASSWSSAKFDHRAPPDCALIRVFVGGARDEQLAEMNEAALVQLARRELNATMGIATIPILAKAYRWHKGIPQYEVGHQARIAEIDRIVASHSGLHLAGAAYHASGIPGCIQSGVRVAQSITIKSSISGDEPYTGRGVPLSVYGS